MRACSARASELVWGGKCGAWAMTVACGMHFLPCDLSIGQDHSRCRGGLAPATACRD